MELTNKDLVMWLQWVSKYESKYRHSNQSFKPMARRAFYMQRSLTIELALAREYNIQFAQNIAFNRAYAQDVNGTLIRVRSRDGDLSDFNFDLELAHDLAFDRALAQLCSDIRYFAWVHFI